MRMLLDTHVAIWAVAASTNIPEHLRLLIEEPKNDVYVSMCSLWEIAIKSGRGGVNAMPFSAQDALRHFKRAGFAILDIRLEHILAVEALPLLHRDPFDRLLVAQSNSEPLRLITHDKQIAAYGEMVISW